MRIPLPINRICTDLYWPMDNFHPVMINDMHLQISILTSMKWTIPVWLSSKVKVRNKGTYESNLNSKILWLPKWHHYYFIKNHLRAYLLFEFFLFLLFRRSGVGYKQLGIGSILVLGDHKTQLLKPDCFQRLHITKTWAPLREPGKLSKEKILLHLFDKYRVYWCRCPMQNRDCASRKLSPTLQKELKLRNNSSLTTWASALELILSNHIAHYSLSSPLLMPFNF